MWAASSCGGTGMSPGEIRMTHPVLHLDLPGPVPPPFPRPFAPVFPRLPPFPPFSPSPPPYFPPFPPVSPRFPRCFLWSMMYREEDKIWVFAGPATVIDPSNTSVACPLVP